MKILAFQQNPWARESVRANAQAKRFGHRWTRRFIAVYMPKSHSGRRLKAAFGELFDLIVWDNVSPVIADHASGNPGPDVIHVLRMLQEEQPDIVLAFGRVASETLQRMWNGPLICGPHPAARQEGVTRRLKSMADELKKQMLLSLVR